MHRRNLFKTAGLMFAGLFASLSEAKAAVPEPDHVAPQPAKLGGQPTLSQQSAYLRANGELLRADIVDQYAESELLAAMPWLDVMGGAYYYFQESYSPGVAFKHHPRDGSVGIVNPQVEILKIVGGDSDLDKALVRTHGESLIETARRRDVRLMAYHLTDVLINGDSENPKPIAPPRHIGHAFYTAGQSIQQHPFDGLRTRVVGQQKVNAHGALRVSLLDETIDSVDGASHLLMAVEMRDLLDNAGLLRKEYVIGRKDPVSYHYIPKGTRLSYQVITDYRLDDQPHILGFNEPRKTTSIFVLNISDSGFCGLQNGMLEADYLGEVNDKPVVRTRIEWLAAYALLSGRSAAHIHAIRNAPVRA